MLNVFNAVVYAIAASQTYGYTGSVETFSVPQDVNTLVIDMCGAAGGLLTSGIAINGFGARITTTIPVSAGSTLYIRVGGQPSPVTAGAGVTSGGFNGGGNGFSSTLGGTGGGGASDIRTEYSSLASRLVVAGGGGGGYYQGCGDHAGDAGQSGSAGCGFYAGGGATQTSGGTGADEYAEGTLGFGGAAPMLYSYYGSTDGGGGGGGYYGGGGMYFALET